MEEDKDTLLDMMIRGLGAIYAPEPGWDGDGTRMMITTNEVINQFEGIAQFSQREIAEKMVEYGYHATYDFNMQQMKWEVYKNPDIE